MHYLGPLRSYPARHYLISGGSKSSVGIRGEDTPQVIYRSSAVTRDINDWLTRFEIPYKLAIKPLGDEVTGEIVAMHLKDTRSKVELAPSDVGFGIGQLLPIIVQGLVSEGRILCVEQPEIHLHPRLQAHLADYLIATSIPLTGQTRRVTNQWIVETHSESLVLRLQRRIREGVISPQHVSILYVRSLDDGASEIVRLRMDETGEFIDAWPDGFFEEAYNELMS
jgi:predicted ATPase